MSVPERERERERVAEARPDDGQLAPGDWRQPPAAQSRSQD